MVRRYGKQEILAVRFEGLKIKELRVLEGLREHSKEHKGFYKKHAFLRADPVQGYQAIDFHMSNKSRLNEFLESKPGDH